MEAVWYFDFISPYAHLQLPKILALRERVDIAPRPVVLAALLAHHGQLGPAEIASKRQFTYRNVQWRAEHAGIDFRFPPSHPFHPIAALRLAVACASSWPSVCAIFEHLWTRGERGDDAPSLLAVARELGIDDIDAAIGSAAVKEELRANTDEAIRAGVFGVPTLRVDDLLFWGDDATGMIDDHFDDRERFTRGEYARIARLPSGRERAR